MMIDDVFCGEYHRKNIPETAVYIAAYRHAGIGRLGAL